MITREVWRSVNKVYFTKVISELLKKWSFFELADHKHMAKVTAPYEVRREAKLKEYFELCNLEGTFNDGYVEVTTGDSLADLARYAIPFADNTPRFPNTDIGITAVKGIVRAFMNGTVARNQVSDEVYSTLRSLRVNCMSSLHCSTVMFDKGKYAFATIEGDTIAISVSRFDEFVASIKTGAVTEGINYRDNVTEYLNNIGIKDATRLLELLTDTDGGDSLWSANRIGGFGRAENDTLFNDVVDEAAIKTRIKVIANTLKALDRDLTLLQYTDLIIKKNGGTEQIHSEYIKSITDVVDKNYNGVKPCNTKTR